jgi:hypothetical protein
LRPAQPVRANRKRWVSSIATAVGSGIAIGQSRRRRSQQRRGVGRGPRTGRMQVQGGAGDVAVRSAGQIRFLSRERVFSSGVTQASGLPGT